MHPLPRSLMGVNGRSGKGRNLARRCIRFILTDIYDNNRIMESNYKRAVHPFASVSPNFLKIHSRILHRHPLEDLAISINGPLSANCVDRETGNRPVHIAAECGYLEALQLLFRHGANLSARNYDGNTALHVANSHNNFWCAKFLKDYGVSTNTLNDAGIPAWAGEDGTHMFPTFTKALGQATTHSQVRHALRLLDQSADRTSLDEFLRVFTVHIKWYPYLWPKKIRKLARQLSKKIKKVGVSTDIITTKTMTALGVFEKIRNEMNDNMERITHVFRRLDIDQSGELDRRELLIGLKELNVRLEPNEIKLFLREIDPNNDGNVSFQELERAIKGRVTKAFPQPPPRGKVKAVTLPSIGSRENKKTGKPSRPRMVKTGLGRQTKCRTKKSTSQKKIVKVRYIKLRRDIGGPVNIGFKAPSTAELKESPFYEGKEAWHENMPGKFSTFDPASEDLNFEDMGKSLIGENSPIHTKLKI